MFHTSLKVLPVDNITAMTAPMAARLTVRRRAMVAAPLLLPLVSSAAGAQGTDWPTRPVRILLAYPPGGSTDVLARTLAERLAAAFPGPGFVVENRPGGAAGGGTPGGATAAADGHTPAPRDIPTHAAN